MNNGLPVTHLMVTCARSVSFLFSLNIIYFLIIFPSTFFHLSECKIYFILCYAFQWLSNAIKLFNKQDDEHYPKKEEEREDKRSIEPFP